MLRKRGDTIIAGMNKPGNLPKQARPGKRPSSSRRSVPDLIPRPQKPKPLKSGVHHPKTPDPPAPNSEHSIPPASSAAVERLLETKGGCLRRRRRPRHGQSDQDHQYGRMSAKLISKRWTFAPAHRAAFHPSSDSKPTRAPQNFEQQSQSSLIFCSSPGIRLLFRSREPSHQGSTIFMRDADDRDRLSGDVFRYRLRRCRP